MRRKRNPEYFLRFMSRDRLLAMELSIFTGNHFGCSIRNESLLTESGWIDDEAHHRYSDDSKSYRGWSVPGRLYCRKCWTAINGIPREIIQRNWCSNCDTVLYEMPTEEQLDFLGFFIYRRNVTRYTDIAASRFSGLVKGHEKTLASDDSILELQRDHIFSVRDAFENNVDEYVVSIPTNIRWITGSQNASKGRRSDFTLQELMGQFHEFTAQHPHWMDLIRASDNSESDLAYREDRISE